MLNYLAAQGLIADELIMAGATDKLKYTAVRIDDPECPETASTGMSAITPTFMELMGILGDIESPIEQVMFGLLVTMSIKDRGFFIEWATPELQKTITTGRSPYDCIEILPQAEVGQYKIDFLVCFYTKKDQCWRVAIECDGHAFHEKTKAQASKDKKRDRDITAEGITVLHFTGSEIWNTPFKVRTEISDYINHIIEKEEEQNAAR